MYALFKDGKKRSESYKNIVGLWVCIVLSYQEAISGTVNSLHFACTLREGYTIEEVKE
jgi:hypothetical protein